MSGGAAPPTGASALALKVLKGPKAVASLGALLRAGVGLEQ